MREILFRGKREGTGEWVWGFLVDGKHIGNWVVCTPVIPETVGQFTGLTDKKGMKIFEGDIIECLALSAGGIPEKMKGFITWGTYGWVVNFGELEPWQGAGFALVGLGCVKDIEIVGNTHDNPEITEPEAPAVL